jgi:hypothetical protein
MQTVGATRGNAIEGRNPHLTALHAALQVVSRAREYQRSRSTATTQPA